ncbi:hypothetical protein BVI434_400053 [Burkholderia vietnamiensis]|nr:hypothetical protein BVI434_400053 [Burkholderia vietnamiensis]
MRDARLPQRRDDDGLLRARRADDEHALRHARPRRRAAPARCRPVVRRRARSAALSRVGAQGRVGRVRRSARAARMRSGRRRAGARRARAVRPPHRARGRRTHRAARRARHAGFHGRHRRTRGGAARADLRGARLARRRAGHARECGPCAGGVDGGERGHGRGRADQRGVGRGARGGARAARQSRRLIQISATGVHAPMMIASISVQGKRHVLEHPGCARRQRHVVPRARRRPGSRGANGCAADAGLRRRFPGARVRHLRLRSVDSGRRVP